jgi:alkanesulfonate monooxygenase SsuD/methylene tetrahydromethanopterin reductase-like flavin-dependent oxidoreductase (luciferase family)
VRLSAFTVCDTYPSRGTDGASRLAGFLRLAEVAENAGLDAIWVGEHHFRPEGVCPSPAVLLSAAAQRTHRLRLGVLVSVLPLHPPVTVAEEYAMVDVLSGGRLNLGVGSGYVPEELWGHGVDPHQRRERFEVSLADLVSALEGKPVAASDGTRRDLRINVRPVQQPHPPIWIAVQRPATALTLGGAGRSIALLPYATVRTHRELLDLVTAYRRAAPAGTHPQIAVALHLYVGPEPDRARDALRRYLGSRLASGAATGRRESIRPGHLPTAREVESEGFAQFGSAEEVLFGLRLWEEAGVDEVLGMFDFGDLRASEAEYSLSAVARAWQRAHARPLAA